MLQNSSPLFSFCHIPFGKANHLPPRLIPRFLGARHRRTWAVAYPVARSRSSAPPEAVRTALPCCAVPARYGAMLGRRASRLAPPPVAARHRGAWLGIVHTLRVLHAAALSAARCAAEPRTRRDVMIAPPFRPRITRAARWGHRALPPLHPRGVRRHYPRALHRLCAPWSCPVVRSRCGRARCPHRAAAPSARCAAWHRAHRVVRWGDRTPRPARL